MKKDGLSSNCERLLATAHDRTPLLGMTNSSRKLARELLATVYYFGAFSSVTELPAGISAQTFMDRAMDQAEKAPMRPRVDPSSENPR